MKFIDKHNKETAAGQHTYTVGINEFADFTSQEFVKYFNGLKMNHTLQMNVAKIQKMRKDLPASVDWRKEVDNQSINNAVMLSLTQKFPS